MGNLVESPSLWAIVAATSAGAIICAILVYCVQPHVASSLFQLHQGNGDMELAVGLLAAGAGDADGESSGSASTRPFDSCLWHHASSSAQDEARAMTAGSEGLDNPVPAFMFAMVRQLTYFTLAVSLLSSRLELAGLVACVFLVGAVAARMALVTLCTS